MRYLIDDAEFSSSLAVCQEEGCQWRGLADSHLAALKRAAIHEEMMHPGQDQAREAFHKATHRSSETVITPGRPPRGKRGPTNRSR